MVETTATESTGKIPEGESPFPHMTAEETQGFVKSLKSIRRQRIRNNLFSSAKQKAMRKLTKLYPEDFKAILVPFNEEAEAKYQAFLKREDNGSN